MQYTLIKKIPEAVDNPELAIQIAKETKNATVLLLLANSLSPSTLAALRIHKVTTLSLAHEQLLHKNEMYTLAINSLERIEEEFIKAVTSHESFYSHNKVAKKGGVFSFEELYNVRLGSYVIDPVLDALAAIKDLPIDNTLKYIALNRFVTMLNYGIQTREQATRYRDIMFSIITPKEYEGVRSSIVQVVEDYKDYCNAGNYYYGAQLNGAAVKLDERQLQVWNSLYDVGYGYPSHYRNIVLSLALSSLTADAYLNDDYETLDLLCLVYQLTRTVNIIGKNLISTVISSSKVLIGDKKEQRYIINHVLETTNSSELRITAARNASEFATIFSEYNKQHYHLKEGNSITLCAMSTSDSYLLNANIEDIVKIYRSRYWVEFVMFIRGICGKLTDDELYWALTHETNSNIQQGAMLFMRTMNRYSITKSDKFTIKDGNIIKVTIKLNDALSSVAKSLPGYVNLNEVLEQQFTTSYAMYGVFTQNAKD